MPNTVNAAFAAFMKDRVNLDAEDTKTARSSECWLYEQIEKFDEDSTFPALCEKYDISFGSFARHTKIRPLDDIDIMSGLNAQGAHYETYSDRIEINVQSESNLAPYCFDGTHKLNSKKVINKYLKKLEGVSQYSSAEMKRNGSAAVLNLKTYDWCFDIVPCFMTKPEGDGRTFYLIPDGNGHWKKTDPRIDRERVRQVNKAHEGSVLNVIRIIKFWNKRPTMPTMGSYMLEAIVLNYYEPRSTAASSFVHVEIPGILIHIAKAIREPVWDPKNIQGDINNLSADDRKKVSDRAVSDCEKAIAARTLEINGDQKGAISKWAEIFGGDFPIYG